MSGVIHRYEVLIQDKQDLMLPKGADFLDAQIKESNRLKSGVSLWFMVPDPKAPKEAWTLCMFGTGHEIPEPSENLLYMATVQMPPFVWHLFELVQGGIEWHDEYE